MNAEKIFEFLKSGKKITVKAKDNVYDFFDESLDPKMLARIHHATEEDGLLKLVLDLSGFEAHNKSVAKPDWYIGSEDRMGIWMETKHYPQDGLEIVYLPIEGELPFELVIDDSILKDYVDSGTTDSYIEFLEKNYIANKK